jgi:hypothetical protein
VIDTIASDHQTHNNSSNFFWLFLLFSSTLALISLVFFFVFFLPRENFFFFPFCGKINWWPYFSRLAQQTNDAMHAVAGYQL